MCREAAVAAIGAIAARPSSEEIPNQSDIGGSEDSPEGLEAVLSALSDRPAVRRRAVIALAAFDGPRVRSALAESLSDRDWQVRQAAEDQLGD
jgi:HEAT repeat protein